MISLGSVFSPPMSPSIKGSLLSRFQGADGSRLLMEVLRSHRIFGGDTSILEEICGLLELQEINCGAEIITQTGADNDLFFILAGEFSTAVNGRPVALRGPGQHVGEMALIDPSARRSAQLLR
jgi:CRP/FNR family transcriptional regulator, cyclic AMP receptor protein